MAILSHVLRSTGGPSHISANDGFSITGPRDTHSSVSGRRGYPQLYMERTFTTHTHFSLKNARSQPHRQAQFGMQSCTYLGHIVGNRQVKPESVKLDAVRTFPQPTSKKQVRAFLGLTGCYRKFIPELATTAAPLTDLMRQNSPNRVVWMDDCALAFDKLKENSTSPIQSRHH